MDEKDGLKKPVWGLIGVFAALHLLCCGVPLLLLSGVSLAFLVPHWPVIGVALVILGAVGFVWYLKRGCATCPRNEGCFLREGRRGEDADNPWA